MSIIQRIRNLWWLSGQSNPQVKAMTFFRNKQAQIVDLIDPLDKVNL